MFQVQVPLKNRPAPYHIPRSPHYAPRQEHPHHTSPSPHQQQVLTSHASPSPTSGVKSPINQNPIPSPGPGMLRSPSGQVMSPCGSQRSPSHSGSSYPSQAAVPTSQMTNMSPVSHPAMPSNSQPQQYHNHQHHHSHPQQSHLVHQSGSPHYSPCSMVQSPYSASPSAQAPAASYSPQNHNAVPPHHHHQSSAGSMVSSPPTNMSAPYVSSPKSIGPGSTFAQSSTNTCNNPLMSLEKLVMLPETQVVDPKSVVNDACLSAQSEEGSKNVEDPAERPVESSGHSVGCSGVSSSQASQSVDSTGFVESVSETTLNNTGSQSDQNVTMTSSCMGANSLSDQSVSNAAVPCHIDSGYTSSVPQPTQINSGVQNNDMKHTGQILSVSKHADVPNSKANITPLTSEGVSKSSSSKFLDNPGNNTDQSCSENGEQSHVGSIETHNLTQSLQTNQTLASSNCSQSSMSNSHSHVPAKTEIIPSSISTSLESCITRSGADLLSTSLPINEKVSGKYAELKEDFDRESSFEINISSQEIDHRTKKLVKSLDKTDLNHQELLLVPKPILNNSYCESTNRISDKESDSNTKTADSSLVQLSKNIRIKEELKLSPVPCHPPTVLSEVPIILNGVGSATICEADVDQELDYSNGIHSKVHNGLSTIVKSKLGFSRFASHLNGITPCSIAVEASERAVCERFSLRRNVRGRTTRASVNRGRNNSTGNADSDESLENISNSTILTSIDPQDGTKKRGPSSSSKRNGFSKSVVVSSITKNSDNSSSTAKVPMEKNTCPPHGTNTGSEEEPCYYEGVDSSYDVYLNTFSSDESGCSDDKGCDSQSKEQEHFSSSAEAEKPADKSTITPALSDKNEKFDDNVQTLITQRTDAGQESEESLSPPSKRLKASPGSTNIENTSITCTPSQESNEVIDLTSETFSQRVKKESTSPVKQRVRSSEKFRPSILGKRSAKYPVVVLEKSPIVSPKLASVKREHSDLINISEGSTPHQLVKADLPEIKTEGIPVPDIANPEAAVSVHSESPTEKISIVNQESNVPPESSISITRKKNLPKKKPRPRKAAKPKGKGKELLSSRQSDVKDSFKSMKFGRTLDLMNANRKREGGSIGPFVRVVGQRSSPKTVSVFAQPSAEVLAGAKQGKTGAGSKKGQTFPSVTTVHMVSNLASKQPPMVPSSRTISLKPWVCAFCGHHSSYKFLGDLFGPYFKENEIGQVEQIALEESKKADSEKNPKPQEFGKKNVTKGQVQGTSTTATAGRQQKRKSALHLRVSEPPAPSPEELWVHQACALWSPGVCLVGNKMYGLDEAVKDAAENVRIYNMLV